MLFLKKLDPKKHVTSKYFKWMNDKFVQLHTEQKYLKHSLKNIKKFFKDKNKSKTDFLFGIFIKKGKLMNHIGNIKLGPINWIHKCAEISYFIGEKDLWDSGYTTLAIKRIIKLAKKKKIKKLKAGCYEKNYGSVKVLKKNGFKLEGKFKSEKIFKKKRVTYNWYGKLL